MTRPKVIVKKLIASEPCRVFDAWTQPELMQRWFTPKGWTAKTTADLRVGGEYRHDMIPGGDANSHLHSGHYLEVRRPDKLVFTWNAVSHAEPDTKVTVEFLEEGDSTEVVITHEELPTEELRRGHAEGWTELLDNLAECLLEKA